MTDPNNKTGDPETHGSSPPSATDDHMHVGEDEVTPDSIADTLTHESDEVSLSAAKTIGEASEQVVVRLGIEKFIEKQWDKIDEKLRECDEYAVAAATFGGNMIFISMAIPLVNGVIHVGSTREKLTKTSEWIAKEWRKAELLYDPERIPVISALTLIYLITKGWNAITNEWEPALSLHPELNEKDWKASESPEDKKLEELKEQKESWERMKERVQRLCSDKDSRGAKSGPVEPKDAG